MRRRIELGGVVALSGALVLGPVATATAEPSGPVAFQDSAHDLMLAKCTYGHEVQACKNLALEGKHVTSSQLRCLAAAGIAVGGVILGEGIPEAVAAAIARKYVVAGAAACLGSFIV